VGTPVCVESESAEAVLMRLKFDDLQVAVYADVDLVEEAAQPSALIRGYELT
jgi:hypothetical protein